MDKYTQEIINFTRQLVKTPSQNFIDSEKEVANLVFKKLSSFGFSPKIIGPGKHPSVICKIKGRNSKIIWLESCLDTVPAGEISRWKNPPFDAKIIENKMFGRGVADSKIAIALFCYLAKYLSETKNFSGSLFLSFDADEQTGNFTGIKEVIRYAPKADICILGYQGIDEISIGARGWLRLNLTTLGKSAHTGSRSKKGINAIHLMAEAIKKITSMKIDKKTEKYFEFGSSLNVAQINGGVAINIVPDKCEAFIDIRLLPSQNRKGIIDMITKKLEEFKNDNPKFNYSYKVLQSERTFLTNPENAFVKILQNTAQKTLGKRIPLVASGQGSVGNIISQKGIPIVNAFGCESDNVHAPNEWVNLDTLPKIFEIYKKALLEFCK